MALDRAEKWLAYLKFEQAGCWMYDPHNVIYNKITSFAPVNRGLVLLAQECLRAFCIHL